MVYGVLQAPLLALPLGDPGSYRNRVTGMPFFNIRNFKIYCGVTRSGVHIGSVAPIMSIKLITRFALLVLKLRRLLIQFCAFASVFISLLVYGNFCH